MIVNDFNQEVFFAFEKKNDLFNKKENKLNFWDLIRFEVFYSLLWKKNPGTILLDKNRLRTIDIIKDFYFSCIALFFKKWDYMFFTASRNKIDNNLFFDQNLEDLIKNYPKNSILIESFERNLSKCYHKNIFFNPNYIFRKLGKTLIKFQDYSATVNLLKSEFGDSDIDNKEINRIVKDFNIDFLYYSFIFRIKKPKVIFITQNGIQKGLFCAAKKRNIPVVEVQHGIIDEAHLGYSYNKDIKYGNSQVYLPTYFFTFSDFWINKLHFPIKRIVCMGNSYFYDPLKEQNLLRENQNGLVVASSDFFGKDLKNIVIEIAKKSSLIYIYFKLHPNQFIEKDYFVNEFLDFKNVKVITNEKSITDLLVISKSILVVQSTALYESLHLKKIAIVLKKQSYKRHSHVFENPNVYLVDTADEIIEVMGKQFVESASTEDEFFKDFDNQKFGQFMADLNE